MNCRTLEYVVAIIETGSLREAALKCNATRGTISGQISRLEDYLGVTLFESRAEPAMLTKDGEKLAPMMVELVEKIRNFRRVTRGISLGNRADARPEMALQALVAGQSTH